MSTFTKKQLKGIVEKSIIAGYFLVDDMNKDHQLRIKILGCSFCRGSKVEKGLFYERIQNYTFIFMFVKRKHFDLLFRHHKIHMNRTLKVKITRVSLKVTP